MANRTFYLDVPTQMRLKSALSCHTCDEWAGILDVNRKMIISLRKGTTQPRASHIKLICDEAKVSADWVLGLDGNNDA